MYYCRTGDMREGYLHADAAKIVLKDMCVSPFPIKGNFYVQKRKGEMRMPQASTRLRHPPVCDVSRLPTGG
jgi:hypothetical protein